MMKRITRKYLEKLAYASGFMLGAFAFLAVGAYRLSQKCLWKAEDVVNEERPRKKPCSSPPYVDPKVKIVVDDFAFGLMCQVHPDARITNRDVLFNAMAQAAFQTATQIRQTTGHVPESVDLETRLVTLNRVIRFRTKLRISPCPNELGRLNVSIPDDEANKWHRFGFAMKCFLN